MLNKRAIELSLNFIVIIVITLIIFGFGVNFISRLSSQATELQEMTVSELDERIGSLICESSDRVCVGIDRKTISKGDFGIFGLKILNIVENENFEVIIKNPENYLGYKKDGNEIAVSNPKLIVNPAARSVNIKKNEERDLGIGIEVPDNAVPGTYILNVEIKNAGALYGTVQKLYVDVP